MHIAFPVRRLCGCSVIFPRHSGGKSCSWRLHMSGYALLTCKRRGAVIMHCGRSVDLWQIHGIAGGKSLVSPWVCYVPLVVLPSNCQQSRLQIHGLQCGHMLTEQPVSCVFVMCAVEETRLPCMMCIRPTERGRLSALFVSTCMILRSPQRMMCWGKLPQPAGIPWAALAVACSDILWPSNDLCTFAPLHICACVEAVAEAIRHSRSL